MLYFSTKNKLRSLFFALGISLSSVGLVSALTISPARVEITGDPGTSIPSDFLLINEQESEQTFYTSIENFEAQGESGTPSFTTSEEGLAAWVSVTEKVVLRKGERARVPFVVHIPKNADAGGHFAAIFLSTVPPSTKAGEVAVGAKVGMLILLKVNGDLKEEGGILAFSLKENKRIVTQLPVDFVYRFRNDGNDRINPTGDITIHNTFGLISARINANPAVGNILPDSTRRFDIRWGEEDALPQSASFLASAGYQMRNFAFGFYHANIQVTFGANSSSDASTLFFVFPWHLLVIVSIILGIAFILLRNAVKRYNRWIIQQAKIQE